MNKNPHQIFDTVEMKFVTSLKRTLGGSLFATATSSSRNDRNNNNGKKATSSSINERASVDSGDDHRPRVSFRDEEELEEIFPAPEYDREAFEAYSCSAERDAIYDELIDYLETEMVKDVHPSAKHTVVHGHLYGGAKEAASREYVRQKCREANKDWGTNSRRSFVRTRKPSGSSSQAGGTRMRHTLNY